MATVIKSNVAYGGDVTLPSAVDLTYTAQAFYNEYAARVVADGGRVVDPAATLAAISWAKGAGVMGKIRACGASWGVKESAGVITKMYGLGGEIYSPRGGGVELIESGAFPVIRSLSDTSYMVTDAPDKNIKTDSVGMFACIDASFAGPTGWQAAVIDGVNSTQSDIYLLQTAGGNPSIFCSQDDGSFLSAAQTPKAAFSGFGGVAVPVLDNIYTSLDGVNGGSAAPTPPRTLADLKSAATSRIMLFKRQFNGAPYGSPGTVPMTEFWLINDCTEETASAITGRLWNMYGTP
ncbi:MAG: hypothetical protein HRT34_01350 [Alcanivorax sp.]|nr:hypothetical protein [Alcanivorax sp.]